MLMEALSYLWLEDVLEQALPHGVLLRDQPGIA